MAETSLTRSNRIERKILLVRGHKVMLDADLAELYEIENKLLIRAVRRNLERFPEDFMFQLNTEELDNLRIQIGSSRAHGGRRYRPYAFTEQGVAMLSCVLRSRRAVQVNIEIMRAFVRLRRFIASHAELAKKVQELERASKRHDVTFEAVFLAMRKLMAPKPKPVKPPGGSTVQ